MITGINESKTLIKHVSCECKCKLNGTKCNSSQWRNNDKCRCESKKHHIHEKEYVWNKITYICENGKYLASIIDDLMITCDEVIESCDEETKTIPKNLNEKNVTCKTQSFYILLNYLLITIVLLMAVSIYCYLIKHQAKQKHLLPFRNKKLKKFCAGSIN